MSSRSGSSTNGTSRPSSARRAVSRVRRKRVCTQTSIGTLATSWPSWRAVCSPSGVGRDDEELAPVRVRARVRHREGAPLDLVVVELVLELVAGAARAGARRVAALDHEVRDDPVEDHAVVEALAGQLDEVLDGPRRGPGIELELDHALIGVQRRLSHATHGNRSNSPGWVGSTSPVSSRLTTS